MKERLNALTEGTLIPLSLVILLGGCMLWVGALQSRATTTAEDLDKFQSSYRDDLKVIQRIDRRLSRIEGALQIKRDGDE